MKTYQLIVFLTVVLTVYASANAFIFIRGLHSIPAGSVLRPYYIGLFLFLSLSYILSRLLEKPLPGLFTHSLNLIGSFWLAAMLLLLTSLLVIDILRFSNFIFHWFPEFITRNPAQTKFLLALSLVIATFLMIIGGYFNAINPRVKTLDLVIHKKTGNRSNLNIVAVTDIHLGNLIGKERAKKMVEKINSLNPDIILLGGDIVDESVASVVRNGSADELINLKAPLGVYAIIGNHELFGGAERAVEFLSSKNITFLLDDTVRIDNSFYLAGRLDKDISRFAGKKRKPLSEILSGADKQLPIILLDHQPFKLSDAAENDIDLQISGHTHYGQLFPANLVTKLIFELSYGYLKTGNTHYYVSSGYGSWGPPVRIFTRSEIVNVKLNFLVD